MSLIEHKIALAALVASGFLLGLTSNLAQVAQAAALTPLSFLTWSVAGAAVLLTAQSAIRRHKTKFSRRSLEYFLVAGFLSTAGANLIFFNAVPRLGVSFVSLMISLPPLLTYLGALALRMEGFCLWRAVGVASALAGTAWLVLQQWAMPGADSAWIAITLIAPVLLAAGNIYRTRRWPPGETAASLAPGTLLGATMLLILFGILTGENLGISESEDYALALILIQALVFAVMFKLIFVLQKAGGPVFLSLMGGVSAIFAVPLAILLLGEPLIPGFGISAVLVSFGILSMSLGVARCVQFQPAKISRR